MDDDQRGGDAEERGGGEMRGSCSYIIHSETESHGIAL